MLLSILLPVRDAGETLDRALASLAAQTFRDWELVAVDDGSRDATPEILARWAAEDSRLRVVRQEPLGIVAALKRAAAEARGELLGRMDADDVCAPERFARQLAFLDEHPETAVVSCRAGALPDPRAAANTAGMDAYLEWINGLLTHEAMAAERFIESPVPHPSVVIRRAAYDAAGGYRDAGWAEDYDLWLRMFEGGARFGKVDAELLLWRDRPERASRTDPRYSQDAFQRCRAHYLARGPLAGAPRFYQWGAGRYGKRVLRLLLERGRRPEALIDIDPKKIGQRVPNDASGVPVLAPDGLPAAGRALVIAAVGSRGSAAARNEIRQAVAQKNYVEGRDFWALT